MNTDLYVGTRWRSQDERELPQIYQQDKLCFSRPCGDQTRAIPSLIPRYWGAGLRLKLNGNVYRLTIGGKTHRRDLDRRLGKSIEIGDSPPTIYDLSRARLLGCGYPCHS